MTGETSVADPHQFDADPEADLDPSFHSDADPDANPDPTFHFDADLDPTFHFDADRIRIQIPKMVRIHADPNRHH
jgi:hypothetical protein